MVTTHEQSVDVRSDVTGVSEPDEPPMMAPVHRALTWERIHRLDLREVDKPYDIT